MQTAEHDRIPEGALDWARAGKGVALATVVETWGSAPRPKGSQLAISAEAEMIGSVSGGCVEGAVVAEALEALEDGRPRMLTYGVSDEEAFAVGLACGGTIRVLVEPVGVGEGPSPDLLAELVAARAARRPWPMRCTPRPGNAGSSPVPPTRSGRRRRRR
jgi:xanthine dehydrogenase accessory factor